MTRTCSLPKRPFPVAAAIALSLAGTMGMSGCTSASQQGSDATAGAAATASAQEGSAQPTAASASPMSTQTWCQAYVAITNNLGSLSESSADAAKGLTLLPTFEQLWRSAGSMGIVSPDESQANIDTVKAFAEVMKLVAEGATQEQIKQADANFTAGTEKVKGLLSSSASSVVKACGLGSSASPSAS